MKKIKLFCLPYAGGSSTMFMKWKTKLSSRIELTPIELSGRGSRINEECFNNFDCMMDDIVDNVVRKLDQGTQFSLLGHSMGCLLAFELYYRLKDLGYSATHVFLLGNHAPHEMNNEKKIDLFSEEALLNKLTVYGEEICMIMEDEEIKAFFLPIIRSDFEVLQSYKYRKYRKKIECECTIINGNKDLSIADYNLDDWRDYISSSCCCYFETIPGGHFFVQDKYEDVVNIVNKRIG
ncbi:thioesterase domain-containing protein [uncultured Phocaeicola sp.]|uniref:thioesterase II family protein n=1 Tax=uncultured Phocaeicola sp. TaxID=990718 RepID=UPI0025A2E11C|nr:thioesterase domain-containing protein [uncultured Phocaeicola sp.]